MRAQDTQGQYSGSKWLEGLVLLLIIAMVIVLSTKGQPHYTTIFDEKVSTWSGESIDNLE